MRRMLLTLSTVLAIAVLAQPADAQFKFGAQGAMMTSVDDLSQLDPAFPDLGGTLGLGGRVAFQPPLLPIGVIGQGVYYLTDADDYDYMTYSLAAQLRIPLPVVSPYALGGYQWRRTSTGGVTDTETGFMAGIGVQVNLVVSLFLEATMELNDEIPSAASFDNDAVVIKGGIMFGN